MSGHLLTVNSMAEDDLDAVMAIDQHVYPVPWSRALWLAELQREGRIYLTAHHNDQLVGYVGALVAVEDVHIMTVVSAPQFVRTGVATRLMLEVLDIAVRQGATALTLEVRLSNTAAQALYKRFGMVPAGIRKGYYQPDGEDAVVMWARDIHADAYQSRLSTLAHALETAA